jgi:methionine synthase II (cobalamin-independent)
MFATLAGGYPRPDLPPDATADDLVRAVIADLEDAGVQILSDADLRHPDPIALLVGRLEGLEAGQSGGGPRALHEPRWDGPILVDGWLATKAMTELPVKQAIVGPYTLARAIDPGPLTRERLTMSLADALAHEIRALVAAGAPMVEIEEPDATAIGGSLSEGQLFKAAHRRLTQGAREAHLTLAIRGGSIANLPQAVLFDAPYRSYAIDVVTHPENWQLVIAGQAERGMILGIADARNDGADDPEHLAWAAAYAASIFGRGPERVGLAPSGSLAGLTREQARRKLELLADVAAEVHERIATNETAPDTVGLVRDGLLRGWLPATEELARAAAARNGGESA